MLAFCQVNVLNEYDDDELPHLAILNRATVKRRQLIGRSFIGQHFLAQADVHRPRNEHRN